MALSPLKVRPLTLGALFAVALAGGILTQAGQGRSAIDGEVDSNAASGPITATRQYYLADRPVRAECWQEGKKVIDEAELAGFTFNTLIDEQSVSFRRQGEVNPSVFILAFRESLCLVQAVR